MSLKDRRACQFAAMNIFLLGLVALGPLARAELPVNQYLPPDQSYDPSGSGKQRSPDQSYGPPVSGQQRSPDQSYGAPSSGQAKSPDQSYGPPALGQQRLPISGIRPNGFNGPNGAGPAYLPPSQQYGAPSGPGGANGGFGGPGGFGGNGGGFNGGFEDDGSNEPAKYEFEYTVYDPPSGNDFGHKEMRDGDITRGVYYVLLPDGRRQKVEYEADQNGYRPKITYEQANNGNGNGGIGGIGGVGGSDGLGGANGGYTNGGQNGYQDGGQGGYPGGNSGYRY